MSSSSPRFSSASVSCSHRPVGSAAAEPPFEPAPPPPQSLFAKPPHRPARKDHPKPAACGDSQGACQRPRTGGPAARTPKRCRSWAHTAGASEREEGVRTTQLLHVANWSNCPASVVAASSAGTSHRHPRPGMTRYVVRLE